MIDWVLGFEFNSLFGVLLYWLPLGFCAVGYLARTHANYRHDKAARETPGGVYAPTDTLGTLLGRGLVAVVPVANLCAAVFDLGPELFGEFFGYLERLFNVPLVPDSDAAKEKRKLSTRGA